MLSFKIIFISFYWIWILTIPFICRYFIVSVWVLAAFVASPFLFYRKIVEIRVKFIKNTSKHNHFSSPGPTNRSHDAEVLQWSIPHQLTLWSQHQYCHQGPVCQEDLLLLRQHCHVLHPHPPDDHLLLYDRCQAVLQHKSWRKIRKSQSSSMLSIL